VAIAGPTTVHALAGALAIDDGDADEALLALESEGLVLRGVFERRKAAPAKAARQDSLAGAATSALEPSSDELQWCDRRLLARIHRYTLNRLRSEIEPVSPATRSTVCARRSSRSARPPSCGSCSLGSTSIAPAG
jgi:ATP-dependent Lhr-like helicase